MLPILNFAKYFGFVFMSKWLLWYETSGYENDLLAIWLLAIFKNSVILLEQLFSTQFTGNIYMCIYMFIFNLDRFEFSLFNLNFAGLLLIQIQYAES